MCDRCCTVAQSRELESFRDGVMQMIQQQQSEKSKNVRFPWSCEARRGGMQRVEKESARATLNAQSAQHEARSGPKRMLQCTGGAPACPAAGSAKKYPRPVRDECKRAITYICRIRGGARRPSGIFEYECRGWVWVSSWPDIGRVGIVYLVFLGIKSSSGLIFESQLKIIRRLKRAQHSETARLDR